MKAIYLGAYKALHPDFDVVYQDINGKRDVAGDMLDVDLTPYDFVIATPPCNFWSIARGNRCSQYSLDTKHLLPDIIKKCAESGKKFVIENVINKKRFAENGIYDVAKSCGCSSIKLQMQTKGCTGASYTRLYTIWISMKMRCLNPKRENYFKKGISVCQEWSSSFDNFYKWSMENGYSDNLTIDRINNNGNYEPNNCRWTDMTTQNRNKDIQKNNKTGCSGVYLYKKPSTYRATIGVNGKKISLGLFNTLKEAIDARKNAERMYWKVQ